MALYAGGQGTDQKADQISAAKNYAHVDHRHGKNFIWKCPGLLKQIAEFAEWHGWGQQTGGKHHRQKMKELIAYVSQRSIRCRMLPGELYFSQIDQQMYERQSENHEVCSRQENGTA